ncbi:PAS domain-containing sensor histidine kinase [Wenzhouxiangella sediminis]|uniref:histidine kinase n=1 Tax=Wenzhouxiangella sediminis TaxID=1792836 RepID=A0A3E1K8B2_9GAMM|nr:PAS domain-containing sensor histidine kinase [Wenzhouxiangella sediminis]
MPFELRLLVLCLAGGLPALLGLGLVLASGDFAPDLSIALVSAASLAWLVFGFAARRFVIYHLQTLSNLLEALREGDYSLRGRRARYKDSLGEVMREVNQLSETLRAERLGAREASALLMKVVDAVDIAVLAFDGRKRLRLVNPAGERLLGRSESALRDQTAAALSLESLLEGPERQTIQHRFAAGSGRWEVRISRFREGGIPHYLLVVTDLSRALREEERKAWQRLIRVIGHELNNSLAPIKSMSGTLQKLLSREPLPEDWREDTARGLDVIGNRADSLGRFMTAYSMLARLPSPRRSKVDLRPLVERVAALDQRVPVLCRGESLSIHVDRDQIEQMLINLVKNAVDAAEQTGGEVRVEWRSEGDGVRISVIDSGPGISNPDNLFVPFFTTKPEGTGVGLVLCQQIVEAHGGVLTLVNRDDARGCVATVELPVS